MNLASTILRHDILMMELHESLQQDNDEESADYVKWQGSQTACSALNQLIKSSANEPHVAHERRSTPKGWQRQPSFDQIPGFSLLSTKDADEYSPPSQAPSASSSSKPMRPSLARPRSSNTGVRNPLVPPGTGNDEPAIPLLGKAYPSLFIDMLRGVSAHLDKSVGVNSGKTPGAGYTTRPTKRPRHTSLGSTPEVQPGQVKRGRVSAPHELEGNAIRAMGKGKARDSFAPALNGTENTHVDSHFDERRPVNSSGSGNTTSSTQGTDPLHWPSAKTFSQSRMPPPALPNEHPGPVASTSRTYAFASSSNSSAASSTPHSNSSYDKSRNHTTPADPAPVKSEPIPKYHPLLLARQSKPTLSANPPGKDRIPSVAAPITTSARPQSFPSTSSSNPRQLKTTHTKPPPDIPLPSSTPKPSSSQSARPPALGMRRMNGTTSASIPPVSGALPTKQKGFKPPLRPGSQVHTSSSQAAAAPAPSQTQALYRSQSHQRQPQPQSQRQPQPQARALGHTTPTGSSGSTSSESLRASSSASSVPRSRDSGTASPASPPRSESPVAALRPGRAGGGSFTTARAAASLPAGDTLGRRGALTSPTTLPEPLDGDADSSFGDVMAFDLDALEETMRLYD